MVGSTSHSARIEPSTSRPLITPPVQDAKLAIIPSMQQTCDDVCFLTVLDRIKVVGGWLEGVWREFKAGTIHFAVVGMCTLRSLFITVSWDDSTSSRLVSNCVFEILCQRQG